jgi:hypothetical protein
MLEENIGLLGERDEYLGGGGILFLDRIIDPAIPEVWCSSLGSKSSFWNRRETPLFRPSRSRWPGPAGLPEKRFLACVKIT